MERILIQPHRIVLRTQWGKAGGLQAGCPASPWQILVVIIIFITVPYFFPICKGDSSDPRISPQQLWALSVLEGMCSNPRANDLCKSHVLNFANNNVFRAHGIEQSEDRTRWGCLVGKTEGFAALAWRFFSTPALSPATASFLVHIDLVLPPQSCPAVTSALVFILI